MDLEDKIEYHKQGAEKEYERFRKLWERGFRSTDSHDYFVSYYARLAMIAELQRKLIGVEKNKLQQRIGRQREANRELQEKIKEKQQAVDNAHATEVTLLKEIAHLKEQLASTTWRANLPHQAYNKEVGSE